MTDSTGAAPTQVCENCGAPVKSYWSACPTCATPVPVRPVGSFEPRQAPAAATVGPVEPRQAPAAATVGPVEPRQPPAAATVGPVEPRQAPAAATVPPVGAMVPPIGATVPSAANLPAEEVDDASVPPPDYPAPATDFPTLPTATTAAFPSAPDFPPPPPEAFAGGAPPSFAPPSENLSPPPSGFSGPPPSQWGDVTAGPPARPEAPNVAAANWLPWLVALLLAVMLVAVGILAVVNTAKLHTRTNQLHAAQISLAEGRTQINADNATIANQRSRIEALRACLSDIVTLGNEVRANNTKAAEATITKVQQECAPLGFP